MCTVTYIPTKHGCMVTSSRDENIKRAKALPPAVYMHNGVQLIYPKDGQANGSWITISETGNAAVLLNGAFEKHITASLYRKSRGLIFLDILAHSQPEFSFLSINLTNIEPFTLILCLNGLLYEARWDGLNKHFKQLEASVPYIWSSATLYSSETATKRKRWFEKWLSEHNSRQPMTVFNFHKFAGDGDTNNNVLMNRNNQMLTVSITGIEINGDKATIRYDDVTNNIFSEKTMIFNPTIV